MTRNEVLLVIAIIGVLILVMMPAMHSERGYGPDPIRCAARLSIVGKSLAVYASANNNSLPQTPVPSGATWLSDQPRETFKLMVGAVRDLTAPATGDPERIFYCPANRDQDSAVLLNSGADFLVTGYAWFTDRGAGSGGMAALKVERKGAPAVEYEGKFAGATMAGRREMVMDWIVSDTAAGAKKWTGMTFAGRPGVYSTSHWVSSQPWPAGGNVLCFDGHVEWRAFDERKAAALPQGKGGVVFWVPAP
jgi:hypothetical protein